MNLLIFDEILFLKIPFHHSYQGKYLYIVKTVKMFKIHSYKTCLKSSGEPFPGLRKPKALIGKTQISIFRYGNFIVRLKSIKRFAQNNSHMHLHKFSGAYF